MKSFSVISLVAIIALAGESYAQYKPSTSYKVNAGGSYKAPTMGSKMPAVDYPATQMPGNDYSGSSDASGEASAGAYDGSASGSGDVTPKVPAPVKGKPVSGRPIPIKGGPIKFPGNVGGPIKFPGNVGGPIKVGIPKRGGNGGKPGYGGNGSGKVDVGPVDAGIGGSIDGANGGGSIGGNLNGPLGGGSVDGSLIGGDYPGSDVSGEATIDAGLPYESPVSVGGSAEYSPEAVAPVNSKTATVRPNGNGSTKVPAKAGGPKVGGSNKSGYSGRVNAGPINSGIGGSVGGANGGGSVGGNLNGPLGGGSVDGSLSGGDYPGTDVSGEATIDAGLPYESPISIGGSFDYSPEVTVPAPVKTKPINDDPRPIKGFPLKLPKGINFPINNPVRGGKLGQPGHGAGSGKIDVGPIDVSAGGSVDGANGSGSVGGSIDGPLGNGSIGGSLGGDDYSTPAPVDPYPGNAVSGCGGAPDPVVVVGGDYTPVVCPLTSKPSYPTKIVDPVVVKAPTKVYTKPKATKKY